MNNEWVDIKLNPNPPSQNTSDDWQNSLKRKITTAKNLVKEWWYTFYYNYIY